MQLLFPSIHLSKKYAYSMSPRIEQPPLKNDVKIGHFKMHDGLLKA